MLNISAAAAKIRARQFASSFDSAQTRKEPALLSNRQSDALAGFALKYLPAEQRDLFRYSVLNRLSGSVGDGTLRAALIAAATEVAGFTHQRLIELGLAAKQGSSSRAYNSKAARGESVL